MIVIQIAIGKLINYEHSVIKLKVLFQHLMIKIEKKSVEFSVFLGLDPPFPLMKSVKKFHKKIIKIYLHLWTN